MKVSLNIIKELTQINIDENDLVNRLKSQLGEVESVEDFAKKYDKTILAEIIENEDHPDADKLAIYKLNIGSKEPVQVVAGDKNLKVGDHVAYFIPGARVPFNAYPEKFDGIVSAVKLRGVQSNGMIASGRELDLNDNHENVLIIDSKEPPGTPMAKVLGMDDTVLEIENKALTNRADCFGLVGIAREISGIQHQQFISPEWMSSEAKYPKSNSLVDLPLEVEIKSNKLCKRYMGATLSNITIKESPLWLQSSLSRLGMRPINNVVDVTNYIMLVTGQPLHAFDYDKLKSKDPNAKTTAHIVVRRARNDEKITTLDGKTHDLSETNLMICDSENPIAIAGIMGGLDSEIDDTTTNIVLESANFDLYNNRKSSMQLGVFTDAVTRFSKGQDPNLCLPALFKAIRMLQDLADGKVSEIHDVYPENDSFKERVVTISIEKLNSHLGLNLTSKEVEKLLDNVELWSDGEGDTLNVTIPTYRNDIRIPEDVHEEVVRLYGYSKVPITLPKRSIIPVSKNSILETKEDSRRILGSIGANEILTYNFVSLKSLEKHDLDPKFAYKLRNPLSPDLEYMRTSLLPSIMQKARVNLKNGYKYVSLYEINKTHNRVAIDKEDLPYELECLSLVVSAVEEYSKNEFKGSPYYQSKFHLEALLEQLNINKIAYLDPDHLNKDLIPQWALQLLPLFDSNAVALVAQQSEVGNNIIGIIGEISPSSRNAEKLPPYTSGFEIDLSVINSMKKNSSEYEEPSHFPKISNDICFIVDRDVPYHAITNAISDELSDESGIQFRIEPIDIYQSKGLLSKGLKYVTVRIIIRHKEKTMTSNESEEIFKRAMRAVKKKSNAKIKE